MHGGTVTLRGVEYLDRALRKKEQEVVLEGSGSLKTINSLLAHIDKITHDAKSGHSQDKSVKQKLAHEDEKEV